MNNAVYVYFGFAIIFSGFAFIEGYIPLKLSFGLLALIYFFHGLHILGYHNEDDPK